MSLKIHKILVETTADCLREIFFENKYADKVVERQLKSNKRWGARDRAFIAATTYNCVRNIRYFNYLLNKEEEFTPENLFGIIGVYLQLKNGSLPNWSIFSLVPTTEIISSRVNEAENFPQIKNSYPDWLYKTGLLELGEIWKNEALALNEPASLVLRTNTLVTTLDNLQQELINLKIETCTTLYAKDALIIKQRANLLKLDVYKKGFFELQDVASQNAAPFLQVKPGMIVIDACCGAGGKTLHLASLMQNRGKLIALDVEPFKLKELKKRAVRNHISIIETCLVENSNSIQKFKNTADRLLLDVPCTGLGVIKRNPDTKWKLTSEFLEQIQALQAQLLQNYSSMLKPGGLMVYATCSILPTENNLQIEKFLAANSNFEFLEEKKFFASVQGFDGFYMALIKRIR